MAVGRTQMILWTTIEFGVVWLITLLVAVRFGLEWVAISYNMAALLYWPRAFMLLDRAVVGGSLLDYFRTLAGPVVVTLVCIGIFEQLVHTWVLSEWTQLFLGGFIAIMGILSSALMQRPILLNEVEALRHTVRGL